MNIKYVEFAESAGGGTLIGHRVTPRNGWTFGPFQPDELEAEYSGIAEIITPERYDEFIQIHGSERAV